MIELAGGISGLSLAIGVASGLNLFVPIATRHSNKREAAILFSELKTFGLGRKVQQHKTLVNVSC
ncbi:hypothetical protein [Rhizobium lusitanum]|uniref:Uncharacterized protein n=1 Tax=Rhizobium lusitanum TaxID=293958 RepID=A0A7X0MCC8_9HYPH|nr:hypothetical protein [Rhizobium lusitanum]MBB6485439.1 hypothetical protein [Rhizobium lusitanum]